jgi:hypothetical protein
MNVSIMDLSKYFIERVTVMLFMLMRDCFKKITDEMLKGECIIHVPCRRGKSIEFLSSNAKKVSMVVGGRILKRVAV